MQHYTTRWQQFGETHCQWLWQGWVDEMLDLHQPFERKKEYMYVSKLNAKMSRNGIQSDHSPRFLSFIRDV